MRALVLSLLAVPVFAAEPTPMPAAATPRVLYVGRALTPADLEGRSLRELTLMRNWVYALRGNEFRRAWLREFFTAFRWYQPDQNGFLNKEYLTNLDADQLAIDDKNAAAIAAYEAALTTEQLTAMRDATRARLKQKRTADDEIELRLLSARLGGWAGEGKAPADLSPLENPALLDQVLTLKQLDDLSPRDLQILRNTIFARRGRAFETPLVKGHFTTISWYAADPKYSDARLTAVDKKNIKLIQSLERQLKRADEPNIMMGA